MTPHGPILYGEEPELEMIIEQRMILIHFTG